MMTDPLRIAVAEDEPDLRDFYARLLPRLGYLVVTLVDNGRDLVQQCRELHPDLIITDIQMDGMTGIEAIQELAKTDPIPTIVVAADFDPSDVAEANTSIFDFLKKPIKATDLQTAIQRFEQVFRAKS